MKEQALFSLKIKSTLECCLLQFALCFKLTVAQISIILGL